MFTKLVTKFKTNPARVLGVVGAALTAVLAIKFSLTPEAMAAVGGVIHLLIAEAIRGKVTPTEKTILLDAVRGVVDSFATPQPIAYSPDPVNTTAVYGGVAAPVTPAPAVALQVAP